MEDQDEFIMRNQRSTILMATTFVGSVFKKIFSVEKLKNPLEKFRFLGYQRLLSSL